GNLFFHHPFLQFLLIRVRIDTNESKWLTLETLDERPLVQVHGPARPSPVPPEIERDYFAAVIMERKLHPVEILALSIGRDLPDPQVPQCDQARLRLVAKRSRVGADQPLAVAVFLYHRPEGLLGFRRERIKVRSVFALRRHKLPPRFPSPRHH